MGNTGRACAATNSDAAPRPAQSFTVPDASLDGGPVMSQQFTEAEIADFLAQLDQFRRTLDGRQQRILDTLLEAAAGPMSEVDSEVEAYVYRTEQPWSVEPRRVARAIRRRSETV
jgi:hypothetical protein